MTTNRCGHGEAHPRGPLTRGDGWVSRAGQATDRRCRRRQRPRRVGEPAPAAIPVSGRGEHRQRMPQQIPAVPELMQGVGGELDKPLHTPLVHPLQMRRGGAPQPAPHGRFGPTRAGSDAPVSKPVRLVQQRSSDDGGGVGATRLQRRRQHDVRGPAAAAADPARAHRHCRCPVRAHRAGATVAPGEQPTTAATRAAQRPGGQVLLGQLGGAGDDHDDRHGSRHTSLAYHTRPHQRPIGVGHTRSRPAAVTDDDDHGVAVTIHTATSLPAVIDQRARVSWAE